MSVRGNLIDLIYDAALEPTVWPDVLAALAQPIGGTAGWLSQLSMADGTGGRFEDPTWRIDPDWHRAYLAHYGALNPFAKRSNPDEYMSRWTMSVNTFDTNIPRDKLVKTEYYNDFLMPQNFNSGLMIRISRSNYDVAVVNITDSFGRDRFGEREIAWGETWQPHLIRAFRLGRKLAEERRTPAAGLAATHGVFILDEAGRVRQMNDAAERLIGRPGPLKVLGGRLIAGHPEEARKLEALVRRALTRDPDIRTGGGLALASTNGQRPMAVSVAPLTAEPAWPYRLGPAAVVCATDLNDRVVPQGSQLRALFGLTPAEIRVALAIAGGESPAAAAERFGVSFQTLRTQLARVYAKTSTRGQPDLVNLVWRVSTISV